jgi:MYXO-CTERM domain-containing protein
VRESDFDMRRMLGTPTRDVHVHRFPTWSAEIDRYMILREHLGAIGCSRVALSRAVPGRDDATACSDDLTVSSRTVEEHLADTSVGREAEPALGLARSVSRSDRNEMDPRPDEPIRTGADNSLRALEGPAEEDLELSGPGDGDGAGTDERLMRDRSLPGGVDHTTAVVGAGGMGLALLGIAGAIRRRRNHQRRTSLDE